MSRITAYGEQQQHVCGGEHSNVFHTTRQGHGASAPLRRATAPACHPKRFEITSFQRVFSSHSMRSPFYLNAAAERHREHVGRKCARGKPLQPAREPVVEAAEPPAQRRAKRPHLRAATHRPRLNNAPTTASGLQHVRHHISRADPCKVHKTKLPGWQQLFDDSVQLLRTIKPGLRAHAIGLLFYFAPNGCAPGWRTTAAGGRHGWGRRPRPQTPSTSPSARPAPALRGTEIGAARVSATAAMMVRRSGQAEIALSRTFPNGSLIAISPASPRTGVAPST